MRPDNVRTDTLLSAVIATGAGAATNGKADYKTFHAFGTTTAGAGAATIVVQGSMTGASWDTIGTITLTLATTVSSDGFTATDRYAQVRGNVTAISGTNAAVTLVMGS
jgi:hypothetical protein